MLAVVVDLLVFLAGAAGLGAAVRAWRAGPENRPVPGWWGVAGYTLAVLVFFSPALLTPDHQIATDIPYQSRPWNETLAEPVEVRNPLLSDPPYQMLPFRDLVRRRWLAGEAPLWAHELGTGQPLLANAQSAPFAPLHLPLLPLPTLRALGIAAAWQVVLGLLLMHALLRRLGASGAGAVVAALAFAFGTFSIAWVYYPMGMTAMFVPGVLLGVILMAEGAPRAAPGLVVCGLAMALSGHPETVAHTALAAAVVVGWLLLRWPRERDRSRLRFVGGLAVAGALTFALAAPYLLPILEALPASERAAALELHPRSERPSDFTLRHLAWLVDPVVAGSPREGGWAGPSNFNEHATLYCGVLPLVLALAGAVVLRGRVLAVVLGGAVALLGAFRLDPVHALLTAVPVLGDGAHGRLRLFWALAVAVAAGLSLDGLLRSRARRGVFALLLAVALGLLIWLGAPPPRWLRLWRLGALAGGLGVLAVPWALSLRASDDRLRRWTVAAVLAAVALDLGLLGIRYNPWVPAELDLAPPEAVEWMVERNREALEGPGELHPFRVLGEDWALFANTPALYGLWNLRGYDPARPEAPARFVDLATQGEHRPGGPAQPRKVSRANVAAHSFLGVRYVLTRHRRPPPAPAWKRVHQHTGGRVWENSRVLPIFFLPEEIEPVTGPERAQDRALERALEIEDYARRAVVEEAVEQGPGDLPGTSWEQEGSVRITEVTGNRFGMEVASPGGAVVVSSVSHDPGWRVRVDGEPAPLLRANSAFLAFRVPPGEHGVELAYSPRGWRWGWRLWGLSVLAVIGWWVVFRAGAGGGDRERDESESQS